MSLFSSFEDLLRSLLKPPNVPLRSVETYSKEAQLKSRDENVEYAKEPNGTQQNLKEFQDELAELTAKLENWEKLQENISNLENKLQLVQSDLDDYKKTLENAEDQNRKLAMDLRLAKKSTDEKNSNLVDCKSEENVLQNKLATLQTANQSLTERLEACTTSSSPKLISEVSNGTNILESEIRTFKASLTKLEAENQRLKAELQVCKREKNDVKSELVKSQEDSKKCESEKNRLAETKTRLSARVKIEVAKKERCDSSLAKCSEMKEKAEAERDEALRELEETKVRATTVEANMQKKIQQLMRGTTQLDREKKKAADRVNKCILEKTELEKAKAEHERELEKAKAENDKLIENEKAKRAKFKQIPVLQGELLRCESKLDKCNTQNEFDIAPLPFKDDSANKSLKMKRTATDEVSETKATDSNLERDAALRQFTETLRRVADSRVDSGGLSNKDYESFKTKKDRRSLPPLTEEMDKARRLRTLRTYKKGLNKTSGRTRRSKKRSNSLIGGALFDFI